MTLTAAPAVESDDGLMALSVRTLAVGEWLQPLRSRRSGGHA